MYGFHVKLLANFLGHKHIVIPLSFDEAVYVVHASASPRQKMADI
jgi:hypothetical protein